MDMMESTQLTFLSSDKTKYFSAEDNPVVVIYGDKLETRKSEVKNIQIRCNFNSFRYPKLSSMFTDSSDNSKILYISVDNSFDIPEDKKATHVFIDHHLYEQKVGECKYHSNSIMIRDNFVLIAKILDKLISTKEIEKICLLFHTDLDGIGSGFMLSRILDYIITGEVDLISKESIDQISLAAVLGEYGDVSEDKEEVLFEVFNQKEIYSSGLKSKMESLTKKFGRFLKAIRPISDYYSHEDADHGEFVLLKAKYDEYSSTYNLDSQDFQNAYIEIVNFFNNTRNIDNLKIASFLTSIVHSSRNRLILDLVQKEIEYFVNSYINPTIPLIDFKVQFTNVDRSPDYKLFLFDSPLDIGRNIMWSYFGKIKNYKANPTYEYSLYHYRNALPYMIKSCENMCSYNTFTGKLSLQSKDLQNAYLIGATFGGGGHANTEAGSIGSATVDLKTFTDNCIIMEMF